MDELLNINCDNELKYYILSKENIKKDVLLIEKKNEETFTKYLMIKCKKEELKDLEKLKIYCYNNQSFENEIQLNKKERRIIEINNKNKIVTFVSIFDDDVINIEEFIDSENLNDYKYHIDKLINKQKNDKKNKKIICIALVVIVSLIIISLLAIYIYKYKYGEKTTREEEDDHLLKTIIYIRDDSHKVENTEKLTIYYNNGNVKYIGPIKNYKANGKGKYYNKDYKDIILYDGNFEEGCPNGEGKRYYYEGNKEVGYYIGSWYDGQRSGKGEMKYRDDDIYIGDFENDVKEGKGIYYYNDGYYYDGEYKNDDRHGKGKVYDSNDKIVCEGNFLKNEYQKSKWESVKSVFTSKPHCY